MWYGPTSIGTSMSWRASRCEASTAQVDLLARGYFPSTSFRFLLLFRLYHLKQFGIVSYKRTIQILTVEDDRIARGTELDRAIEIRFVGIAALAPLFQIDPLGLYRKLGSPAAQFN